VLGDETYRAVCAQVIRLLREERERRKLSKYLVAQKSGLSQQMIAYVERGTKKPSLETVLRIAEALEVDLGAVLKQARKEIIRSDVRRTRDGVPKAARLKT
jgi:transcriptional regulator with XRE-family HTH domain